MVHMRPFRYRAALVAVLLIAAGCGTNPVSATPAAAPADASSDLCPPLSLRMPSGERLNLTGTWLADDFGTYYLTQRASCLHWLGMSPAVGESAAGDWWTNVYAGRVRTDFSVAGPWADVPYVGYSEGQTPNSGELTLHIGFFDDDAGREWPTLHLLEQQQGGGFGGQEWVPTGSLPAPAEYVGTYGYEGGCPSLTVNGERYEIVEWQYDIADQGQLMGDGSQVLARPGDELRIEGQAWPLEDADGCLPDKLLAWDLDVSP